MLEKVLIPLCVLIVTLVSLTEGQRQFSYTLALDPKYNLKTEVDLDKNKIIFEATVQTAGWIGLGISPNPNMISADIFMGWIGPIGNITVSKDYHGSAANNTRPIEDANTISDWKVLSGFSYNNRTMIRFERFFNVTNKQEDREIKDENVYLIWAYGAFNQAVNQPSYHQASPNTRGSRRINLTKVQSSAERVSVTPFYLASLVLLFSMGSWL